MLVSTLVMLLAQPVAGAQTPDSVSESQSTFTETDCPTPLPKPLIEGDNASCGTVNVPAFHDDPDGSEFTLSVTILESTSDTPAAEPLVILTGGPGQASAALLPVFSEDFPLYTPLLERQDVVLFDQRGTGFSEPALECSVDQAASATPISDDAEATPELFDPTLYQDQLLGCGDELRDQGIDLDAFNTTESAADVADLVSALGVDQVDLYGISYGTYLAQVVMRDHPEVVRTSILASPLPLESNVFAGQVIGFDQALDGIFDACENDTECDAAFPNIDDDFETVIADLTAEPMLVDITDPTAGETVQFPVDAPTFMQLLYFSVFVGPFIEAVVPLIGLTSIGDTSALEQILPIILTPVGSAGISTGVLYTMLCNDEAPYTSADDIAEQIDNADVSDEIADETIFAGISANIFDICSAWGIETEPGIQNDPVESDIPTLIVTGEFDPITPPEYGEELQGNLSNSFLVNFANQGHDPLTQSGPCGLTVIDTFLEDPVAGPDTTCVDAAVLDLTPDEPASPEATPAS